MTRLLIALTCLLFLPAGVLLKWSSSAPEPWEYWENHVPGATATVDHSVWDRILQTYVHTDETGLNRFSYGAVTPADKAALDGYVAALEAVQITSFDKPEQLAFWLNLYNALTIRVVLDHYPVASIKDIDISGLLANGPWKAQLAQVEDVALSLNEIEHEILRPIWADPRVHYGVNCASVGCPNLNSHAFTGATVDAVLSELARDFINHPRAVRIEDGKVYVSSIYSWFAHDFGNSQAGVLAHLSRFAAPDLKAQLAAIGEIEDHSYNWTLNE